MFKTSYNMPYTCHKIPINNLHYSNLYFTIMKYTLKIIYPICKLDFYYQ